MDLSKLESKFNMKIMINDDDIIFIPFNNSREIRLSSLLNDQNKYADSQIIYIHKETHEKFIRCIKKGVKETVNKVVKSCTSILYPTKILLTNTDREEYYQQFQNTKKYITIKIPYRLHKEL